MGSSDLTGRMRTLLLPSLLQTVTSIVAIEEWWLYVELCRLNALIERPFYRPETCRRRMAAICAERTNATGK
jgi:hypothetical protein